MIELNGAEQLSADQLDDARQLAAEQAVAQDQLDRVVDLDQSERSDPEQALAQLHAEPEDDQPEWRRCA